MIKSSMHSLREASISYMLSEVMELIVESLFSLKKLRKENSKLRLLVSLKQSTTIFLLLINHSVSKLQLLKASTQFVQPTSRAQESTTVLDWFA